MNIKKTGGKIKEGYNLLALFFLFLLTGISIFVIWIFAKVYDERSAGFNFLAVFGMAVGTGIMIITGFIILFNVFIQIGRA